MCSLGLSYPVCLGFDQARLVNGSDLIKKDFAFFVLKTTAYPAGIIEAFACNYYPYVE